MKLFTLGLVMLISSSLVAQSKKELLTQTEQLKAEIVKLNLEITELKKPKDVVIETEHQRASYGRGRV